MRESPGGSSESARGLGNARGWQWGLGQLEQKGLVGVGGRGWHSELAEREERRRLAREQAGRQRKNSGQRGKEQSAWREEGEGTGEGTYRGRRGAV